MKKTWLSLGIAAILLAGCSSGGGGTDKKDSADIPTEITEKTEIVFWHGMNGDQEKALQQLTDDFMKENDKITVKLQNQSSYPELQQKLIATYVSPKDLPTITQAYPDWVLDATLDGLVEDLEPYIENKEIGMDDFDDIVEGFRKSGEIEGKIYGIPFNKSTEVIFYNKTLFDELKLDEPKDLQEFQEVSKKIYDAKKIPGGGFDSLSNYYVTYLENEGVKFDKEFDPMDKASQAAVNWYLDGIKAGDLRIAGSDKYLSGPFGAEQVAMSVGSTAGESFIKSGAEGKFEVGAARYPMKKSMQQGTDIYMFADAKPIQKTAAFEYMKFLVSKESQLHWAKETGYIPVRKSAIEDKEYQDSGTLIAPIVKEIMSDLYTKPVLEGSNSAFSEAGTMLEKILSDKNSDPDAVLKEFKTTLDSTWR